MKKRRSTRLRWAADDIEQIATEAGRLYTPDATMRDIAHAAMLVLPLERRHEKISESVMTQIKSHWPADATFAHRTTDGRILSLIANNGRPMDVEKIVDDSIANIERVALSDVLKPPPRRELAYSFPLTATYLAQIVVPRDLSQQEADRLCTFIQTLVV